MPVGSKAKSSSGWVDTEVVSPDFSGDRNVYRLATFNHAQCMHDHGLRCTLVQLRWTVFAALSCRRIVNHHAFGNKMHGIGSERTSYSFSLPLHAAVAFRFANGAVFQG